MTHKMIITLASTMLWAGSGCAPEADAPALPPAELAQTVVDPDGPNFLVVGGSAVDVVGEDGAPDQAAGTIVNGGGGLSASAAGAGGWLLAGPQAKSTFLRLDTATPVRADLRDILGGQGALFATTSERGLGQNRAEGYVLGGAGGALQLVDNNGEPVGVTTTATLPSGLDATAGAWIPPVAAGEAGEVLVGDAGGGVAIYNEDLAFQRELASFVEGRVIGIVAGAPGTIARAAVAGPNSIRYWPGSGLEIAIAGAELSALSVRPDSELFAGRADGTIAHWAFESAADSGWRAALPAGEAVRGFAWAPGRGIVLGQRGSARALDASGAPIGEPVSIGDGSSLIGATASPSGGWFVATADSAIVEIGADLAPTRTYLRPLGERTIYALATTGSGELVAGGGGAYRIVDALGTPVSEERTVPGGADLYAASWSGSSFFVGGVGGVGFVIDRQGEVVAGPLALLDGETIRTAAWSGTFWLVAGDEGRIARVRADGTVTDASSTIEGFDAIEAARWSGEEWMAVGHEDGTGALTLIESNGSARRETNVIEAFDAIYAVEWNGIDWLVGGSDGRVLQIDINGEPRVLGSLPPGCERGDLPRQRGCRVLAGQTVRAIEYHKGVYMVGGDGGFTRRVFGNLTSSIAPIAVADFGAVHAIGWTLPRGYSRGACLTNDECYAGPCIGGDTRDGFCCDRPCAGACESCLGAETGGVDGVCTPIVEGGEPRDEAECRETPAAECGTTGTCDGEGGCALWGTETECAPATCAEGQERGASSCDGAGACVAPAEASSCGAFVCGEGACETACTSEAECAAGLICSAGDCVEPSMSDAGMDDDGGDDGSGGSGGSGGGDGGGCAAAPGQAPAPGAALLVLGLLGLGAGRRRRR